MPNMQSLVIARPRLLWGDKVNLIILLVFQVLAIIVLVSVPIFADRWLEIQPDISFYDRWIYLYLPYCLGLVFFASSIWVFSQRRNDVVGQVYSFFGTVTAIGLFCLFDAYTSQRLLTIWIVSTALSGGALINLALIFPEQARVNLQYPGLRYLGYLPAFMLILLTLFFRIYSGYISSFATIWLLVTIFIGLSLIFFIGSTLIRHFSSPSPMVREQARLILWGSGLAFSPLLFWFSIRLVRGDIQLSPLIFVSVGAFPAFLSYTILRYRLLGTDDFLKRGIIYGSLLLLVSGSYALLVSGLGLLAGDLLDHNHPILVGSIIFLIALLVYPLRINLQKRVDLAFFRGREVFQENLQSFGHELTRMTDFEGILHLLQEFVEGTLSPSRIYVYTIDETDGYYIAASGADGVRTSDIRFAKSGALVDLLIKRNGTIFLGDGSNLPENLLVDQARLAVLQAELFVPIRGQSGMVGWLALGARHSGDPYSTHDIGYLESLCDHASLALERSQVVSALERRIHQMDTITKVAEEINQKPTFNELLDMFYSETRKLIPTVDFRITLKSESGNDYHHVFYVANNQRIPNREYPSNLINKCLEAEAVRNQYSIVTVDYVGECKRRGIAPDSDDIHAWMSVPLSAGTETIGAVSLGSRDPSIIYTLEQVNLLQAIADLVAGAIVRARLLEESQKQTRQMATLNELTRSLTSTLDLEPLLNRIMESAVEILDCEAGSLLLVDEQTGESVFEVAIGPVGSELKGKRLPAGVGIVGKAIKTKQAIIENNVRESNDWYNADDKTGFSTRDLMVVPLVVKGLVIGVLEVLNKKDSSPFNQKDMELLTAFAGQVAIAIENARLYTQTDQALAARVDELSIMQRIDRELNASLDFEHVMSITLDSAMRYSEATAGLIGSIKDNALCIIAAEGYPFDDLSIERSYQISQLPGLQELLSNNGEQPLVFLPGRLDVDRHRSKVNLQEPPNLEGNDNLKLLSDAGGHILIPIRRESEIIGVIFMQSKDNLGYEEDIVAFLSRLSDHAAIAISNARLYAELQAANSAKSEFVSAAAHELKNPLTSIKGYSDLLGGGAVGPINDEQAEFVTTIRSNAERMSTLVSDLQDISRIEAGQLQLNFSSELLEDILAEVISLLKKQIEDKGQSLEIQLAEDLPSLWCDNTRLVQILTNLVSNAHKYSNTGGQIKVQAEQFADRGAEEAAAMMVLVSVMDDGIGISDEDQKKVFQQFFRSEDKQVRETTGTGLGLSISKKLVEMQGGKLWFESILGQGTTFYFTIPSTDNNR